MATIVVVEDQPDNLKLITALLTMKGHRVIGLMSGEPLVATLLAEQPPPRWCCSTFSSLGGTATACWAM